MKETMESAWIELFLKKTKPIIIGCVYRPPNKNDFVAELQETITNITTGE